jgi:putative endonuclease
MAKHNEIGKIGEDIASNWLKGRGFNIIERNYLKKYGEIDIVARETIGKIHFIEVKTVSYETKVAFEYAVTHETWRPEDNVHKDKIRRFKHVIEGWIIENDYKGEFQIDILAIRVVPREKYAQVKYLDNIVFE